jgi:hypothetical protein
MSARPRRCVGNINRRGHSRIYASRDALRHASSTGARIAEGTNT